MIDYDVSHRYCAAACKGSWVVMNPLGAASMGAIAMGTELEGEEEEEEPEVMFQDPTAQKEMTE